MAEGQQFCTFFLDNHYFGIEVEKVQEVLRFQDMTYVPLAPEVVRGLINLRGQIVTAIDTRRRLDLPPRPKDQLPMNVIIRANDGAMSLLVDEIGDVLDINEETFEEVPDTVQGLSRELLRGVYKLEGRLLLILNTEKAIDLSALN
ncbi:MAG: chemotaxis protein CheW [Acidobacteria bacterium]|nr:chemotaxis protein CheW [Acidobacteriota bacterium]